MGLDKGERILYNTFITTRNCKGQSMTFDEARDNTTAIEANLSEADAREEAREADHIRNSRHIRLAEQHHPEHNDGANGYDDDDDDDIEEDDGQPSEYVEWQDFMGGDDWDHGQYDDCGW